MDYNGICKKAENHVTNLFETTNDATLVYHNLEHTKKVVAHSLEIAGHYNLIENDITSLCVAAWFHDTGYLFTDYFHHEEKSAELMRAFMKEQGADDDLINNIAECIMATKAPIEPKNLLEQILADADMYNIGTKEFKKTNRQVFDEYNLRTGFISMSDWNAKTLQMMESHEYFTKYCTDMLVAQKKKNMKKIKKKMDGHKGSGIALDTPKETDEKPVVKAQNNLTTKGIQTMLRLTSENHMKLSDMADGKANILLSVNAIIISVILGVLMRRLQVDTYLTIPTIIFLTSSVITVVVAILATRPKVTGGKFSEQDIDMKKTNLLFFGNFYKTSFEDYERAMGKMMVDAPYLYGSLIKDIYHLGIVLARKYKLLRWAYNIFMVGIILSVIAFAIAALYGHNIDAVITNAQGTPL